jgi:phosphatidylglycerol:prolipoprotein diacylglycerol transferase
LFHLGAVIVPSYGAAAAVGVLLALFLAQTTARRFRLETSAVWNLCVYTLFAAIVAERLLLVLLNWSVLRVHPSWMLALAMVHHPLLSGAGALAGVAVAWLYARKKNLPVLAVADALAAPVAIGLAMEQLGALLAGSGYGADAPEALPWAVTYSSTMAARMSGTPLGVALYPVQAYAALGWILLTVFLLLWQLKARQPGDVAGAGLIGFGVVVFLTELWRADEGRGRMLQGALDGPQMAAFAAVLAGAWLLREQRAVSPARKESEILHG